VVEDEFLVQVAVDEFVVEFRVECFVNLRARLVGGSEDGGDGDDFVVLLVALLLEAIRCEDLRTWVRLVPCANEDVVLMMWLITF
jgi:hypothetical protein